MESLTPALRSAVAAIASCLGFYTRLPVSWPDTSRISFADAQWAAPLAGLVVALLGALAFWISTVIGLNAQIAALLTLATTILVSGCLHEDGVADVVDGFGGGATRERKLEIMRDSRIGTYGVVALLVTFALRWSALVAIATPVHVLIALIAAHAASRALMPSFMMLVAPARLNGLSFNVGTLAAPITGLAIVIGVIALLPLGLMATVVTGLALALWSAVLKLLCERQIGGQTGDVVGTLQQGGEIIVLLAATLIFA